MPGGSRSDMGLGRIDMFGRNPMPGGSRSDMGLGRMCIIVAMTELANEKF